MVPWDHGPTPKGGGPGRGEGVGRRGGGLVTVPVLPIDVEGVLSDRPSPGSTGARRVALGPVTGCHESVVGPWGPRGGRGPSGVVGTPIRGDTTVRPVGVGVSTPPAAGAPVHAWGSRVVADVVRPVEVGPTPVSPTSADDPAGLASVGRCRRGTGFSSPRTTSGSRRPSTSSTPSGLPSITPVGSPEVRPVLSAPPVGQDERVRRRDEEDTGETDTVVTLETGPTTVTGDVDGQWGPHGGQGRRYGLRRRVGDPERRRRRRRRPLGHALALVEDPPDGVTPGDPHRGRPV